MWVRKNDFWTLCMSFIKMNNIKLILKYLLENNNIWKVYTHKHIQNRCDLCWEILDSWLSSKKLTVWQLWSVYHGTRSGPQDYELWFPNMPKADVILNGRLRWNKFMKLMYKIQMLIFKYSMRITACKGTKHLNPYNQLFSSFSHIYL